MAVANGMVVQPCKSAGCVDYHNLGLQFITHWNYWGMLLRNRVLHVSIILHSVRWLEIGSSIRWHISVNRFVCRNVHTTHCCTIFWYMPWYRT